jgi:hypothetical protein
MKRYVISSWIDQTKNPFIEHYPMMEAPIDQPIPEPDTFQGTDQQDIPQEIEPSQEPDIQNNQKITNQPQISQNPTQNDYYDNNETEDEEPIIDFEVEKMDYIRLSINQKNDEMMDKLIQMRDIEDLTPGQYKFIEDNMQILSLSRDIDFGDCKKKIYKSIKSQFESLIQGQEETEDQYPEEQYPKEPYQNIKQEIPQDIPEEPKTSNQPMDMENIPGQEGQPEVSSYNAAWNLKGILLKEAPEIEIPDLPGPDNVPSVPGGDSISGTEVLQIISDEIEKYNEINNVFLKLPSFYSMKSDLFRKIICSLTNGIQVGSGGTLEDIFIPISEGGDGIKVCTRIYTDFGNIQIGKWSIKYNDPEKYLSESELEKLNYSGSPEEKEVLRKRVIIESIAENFKDKVYIVFITNPNTGEIHQIGFNFSNLVRDGWKNGYISVSFKANVGKGEAGVKIDGELIDLQNIEIEFIKENPDKIDKEGRPIKDYIELMNLTNGYLYLSIIREEFDNLINVSQNGIFYKNKQFDQGREELLKIQRCIPDIKEILLKKC